MEIRTLEVAVPGLGGPKPLQPNFGPSKHGKKGNIGTSRAVIKSPHNKKTKQNKTLLKMALTKSMRTPNKKPIKKYRNLFKKALNWFKKDREPLSKGINKKESKKHYKG